MSKDEELPPHLGAALRSLPRDATPRTGLEDEIVARLVASGDVVALVPADSAGSATSARPGVSRRAWFAMPIIVALAATLVVIVRSRAPEPATVDGSTYLFLLHEGPWFRQPAPADVGQRIEIYSRWADSLRGAGHLERMSQLQSNDDIVGFFLIRATNDGEARRIADTSPHVRFGGRIEVRKLVE